MVKSINPNVPRGGGEGGGGVKLTPPCGFLKIVSSIERVEPWFFVTFNIILKHIIILKQNTSRRL